MNFESIDCMSADQFCPTPAHARTQGIASGLDRQGQADVIAVGGDAVKERPQRVDSTR